MISTDSSFNVNMTEEQVIYALKCCGYGTNDNGCDQCPFCYIKKETDMSECTSELCKCAYILATGKQPDLGR